MDEVRLSLDRIEAKLEDVDIRLSVLESHNGHKNEDAIVLLDLRIQRVEDLASKSEKSWEKLLDTGLKIIGILLAAALTVKLGIHLP